MGAERCKASSSEANHLAQRDNQALPLQVGCSGRQRRSGLVPAGWLSLRLSLRLRLCDVVEADWLLLVAE